MCQTRSDRRVSITMEKKDYYVCPMGQHMERIGVRHSKTESGYITESVRYRAVRYEGCPLRCMCFKYHRSEPQTERIQTEGA